MDRAPRQQIEHYLQAYNAFDVAGMLRDLHPEVTFENIADGEVTLSLQGIDAFRRQAEQAAQLFRQREQRIEGLRFEDDRAEVAIDYRGTLAVDLPNGLKAGDELKLKGKSVFRFEDGRIIHIQDIS